MIKLSEQERYAFNVLHKVAEENRSVIRAAGGWVRDKLLALDSSDIDIAIDNMTGAQFARKVIEHLNKNNIPHGDVHIIDRRPDQSKHLETAILKFHGLEIDFANLRKESYSDSRIPEIEPGTPQEDALRRDLTINALFFNINNNQIEDFTGKGIDDLKKGICRTPIDPRQTFLDDPLRVLRMIRFASRFCFEIDPNAIKSANTEEVHNAFKKKISRERIWKEMVGERAGFLVTINSPDSLRYIVETGFRDVLFRPEIDNLNPWDTDQNSPHHDLNIWDHTFVTFCNNTLFHHNKTLTTEDIAARNLAAILHDIGKCDLCYRQENDDGSFSYVGHEIGSADLSEIVLEQLSAPIAVKDRVRRLVRHHMRLHNLENNPTNKALRKFIRDLDSDWDHSVDLAISDAYGKIKAWGDFSIRDRYENFRNRISKLLEEQKGETKPARPINGHDLINLGIKPGPLMGKLFAELDDVLLEEPNLTKEDAINFIKTKTE